MRIGLLSACSVTRVLNAWIVHALNTIPIQRFLELLEFLCGGSKIFIPYFEMNIDGHLLCWDVESHPKHPKHKTKRSSFSLLKATNSAGTSESKGAYEAHVLPPLPILCQRRYAYSANFEKCNDACTKSLVKFVERATAEKWGAKYLLW